MSDFDFVYVQVYANTKTALKKAGVDSSKIQSKPNGFKRYGTKTFRQFIYVATVAYCSVGSSNAEDVVREWEAKGVSATIKYHAAD